MIRKIVEVMFLVLIIQVVSAKRASAQLVPLSPSPCETYYSANDLGIDLGAPVPPEVFLINQNNVPGEEGLSIYGVKTYKCPPPTHEGCNCPCSPPASATAGNPINLSTGNTYIQQSDVAVPGLGGGLSLVRTWNSEWPQTQSAYQVGLFGPNWRSSYEERIFAGNDGYIKYSRGNGDFWSFGWAGYDFWTVAAPANFSATLLLNGVETEYGEVYTTWTLTFQSGEVRIFDYESGLLTAIFDRNGNATHIGYDAINRLTSVTDPAGRHLYFGYASSTSWLITSVTSDVGISLSYSYDNQGRLIQLTQPDQTTISFQYDSNSNITAVLDSNGKVLESHTYDSSGRGLSSSRANGVGSVTVSYGTN